MFGSEIIDVVIGIVFVYLLLSLVCTAINEFISSVLRLRARDLRSGIELILNDPELARRFYNHPLIQALHQGKKSPPYIPARTFALALMDIITPAKGDANRLDRMRSAVSQNTEGHVERTLLLFMDEARNNVDLLRENIEEWFNNAMDRVSGKYKQRTQYILFFIGLFVTVFLNADTIAITKSLWTDSALRDALVAQSQVVVQQPAPQSTTGSAPPAATTDERIKDLSGRVNKIKEDAAALQALGLPIGWDEGFNSKTIPRHIPGWLITAFAVSLGAPFWFDVLNKFIVVRSTVKPHEKSPEQPSKDRPAPDVKAEADEDEPPGDKHEEPSKG